MVREKPVLGFFLKNLKNLKSPIFLGFLGFFICCEIVSCYILFHILIVISELWRPKQYSEVISHGLMNIQSRCGYKLCGKENKKPSCR